MLGCFVNDPLYFVLFWIVFFQKVDVMWNEFIFKQFKMVWN